MNNGDFLALFGKLLNCQVIGRLLVLKQKHLKSGR